LLIKKNNIADFGIRITLTGGYSPDGYQSLKANLIISAHLSQNSQKNTAEGIRLITYPHQRQFPEAKTIDYAMAIWLRPLISEKNADDVLYHQNQVITECPRSNIFFVTNDEKIVTPGSNILKGITRMKVLKAASQLFETEEGTITIEDLKNARAAFITSTTKTIMPVSRINDLLFDPFHPAVIRLQDSMRQLQSF
jgi:D-alanine transaminase/branched-chain amino acid aminotransferase